MSKTPPPRAPEFKGLREGGKARIANAYTTVYAACASYGMSETACRRYARDAVSDLTDLMRTTDEELRIG